jgi:hypothetical protein
MLKHPHKDGFLAAADKEYKDLERRGTFKVVKKTQATKTLPVMWVFDYKFDMNGYLAKQKARLCVRGDLQPWTNQDTYAATLAARTFRALMAVTAAFDLEARQLDAVNAFTNSQLDETVYIEFPDGYQMPGYCILLQRALYGLRRSPLLWFKEFSSTLVELKLVMVKEDVCVFTNGWMLVFFFVDDITLLCKTADLPRLESFVQNLMQRYELRDLGELSWFLGIRILRDRPRRRLWLCQDSYIEKIVSKFHLDDVKPATTPMVTEELIPYEGQATPEKIYAYQQKVGSLQYAATISRPDTARAASRLAEFLTNPSPYHQGAVNRALTYLNGTKTLAIKYSAAAVADGQQVFLCASDAAFADDTPTRRSSEGYLFQLFGGPIDWRSTKQKTVTTSSTEAELLSLSHAAKETLWWKRLFHYILLDPGHMVTIDCDNQQTIRLLTKETPKLNTKLRHVDIHHHWLRQEVQEEKIDVRWLPTKDMPADGLTKALPRQRHEVFIKQLGLMDIGGHIKRL